VYEPQADGSMKLGSLEYVILASDREGPVAPELFGQSFEYQPGPGEVNPNRFGLPAFWELHLWVWNENPRGMFDDWNPRVSTAVPASSKWHGQDWIPVHKIYKGHRTEGTFNPATHELHSRPSRGQTSTSPHRLRRRSQ
jgi:hypothetical protein